MISVSLACNFQGLARSQSREVIPVSTEAMKSLQDEISSALDEVANGSGDITITIDEVELTSLVTFELEKLQEPPILSPQVYLRDGQMQIFAILNQDNFNTPIQMTVEVTADAGGYPQIQIISAKMGPVPLPESLLEQMKSLMDDALSEKIYTQTNQIFIRSIEIANGVMTIQGEAR